MPTITPPPPPTLPAAPTSPTPVVTVQSPPPAVTQLNLGHVLQATLTAQLGKGTYTLQTPLGQLTVQTSVALPKLANLVLQLQSLSPQAQFIVNTINGKITDKTLRPSMAQTSQAQSTTASGSAQNAGPTNLNVGTTLRASLLRPLAQPTASATGNTGTASAAAAKPAAPGGPVAAVASLTGDLKNNIAKGLEKGFGKLTPKGLAAAQSAKHATPGSSTSVPSQASQMTTAAQAGAKGTGFLSTGSHFNVKISTIALPSPAATDATTQTPRGPAGGLVIGRSLTGTVTGTTTTGNPIVQTQSGVISLQTPATLPRGSVITLEVTSTPVPPKTDPGFHPGAERQNIFMSRKWPALDETFKFFQEAAPTSVQQVVQTAIPRPGPAFTATVLFFLTALRSGDMRSWLGDTQIRTIERTRPNLLNRMNDDFKALGRIADDPASGDWRVALIPINTGEALEQVRMLMRHGGDDEDDNEKSDTRFIIDVVLSNLGRIQLDGLVRAEGKQLDLMVRSDNPFGETMRHDIQNIFQSAAGASGLTGSVGFQASPANFIDIADPLSNEELGLVV